MFHIAMLWRRMGTF